MKFTTEILTQIVSDAFAACGYDPALGTVTLSDRQDLCQYQCNGAFAGAKLYRKAPFMIAQDVADKLNADSVFAKAEVGKPGFLNLTLKDEELLKLANAIATDPHLGLPQAETPETILVDYGGPNVAKPLHIGHLRAAIIGEALKRLMRVMGHKVIGDVHMGDWGLQIGLVIAELSERYPEWRCFAEDYQEGEPVPALDAASLSEIYPFASQRSKTDAEFSEKAHRFTFDLQNHKPGFIALWKEILRGSVGDLKANYEKLNVDFDLWYGESDADPYLEPTLQIFRDKGLMEESNGAQVVSVVEETDKAPMPPAILIKSDGAVNYQTTDIATILQRQQDFQPDKIWYVVDQRQNLHFNQVFRATKKAGIVPDSVELEHLGFGTMNGTDGKPYKTRDGGVMRLSDMLQLVTDAALEKMNDSGYVDEADKKDLARKIGVAAVKFGDLINHRSKDYIFELDKFLSFEGKTGTYLLYTVTRINSILKKANVGYEEAIQLTGVYSDSERDLLLKILESSAAFRMAVEEKAPNFICENAYQLAVAFSRFYHDNRIIDETDPAKQASWLSLCRLTRNLLLLHFDVLAISPVEHM